jgi:hypothetical protein
MPYTGSSAATTLAVRRDDAERRDEHRVRQRRAQKTERQEQQDLAQADRSEYGCVGASDRQQNERSGQVLPARDVDGRPRRRPASIEHGEQGERRAGYDAQTQALHDRIAAWLGHERPA